MPPAIADTADHHAACGLQPVIGSQPNARFFVQLTDHRCEQAFTRCHATGAQVVQQAGVYGLAGAAPCNPHTGVCVEPVDMHGIAAHAQEVEPRAFKLE